LLVRVIIDLKVKSLDKHPVVRIDKSESVDNAALLEPTGIIPQ